MKKYFLMVICLCLLTACKIQNNTNIIDNFVNTINKSKSYRLIGTMEIQNDEVIYEYDINVTYLKDNYYNVEMTNRSNNQLQVILRNDEGLYV